MTPGPGIEPETHWWEASAFTTIPCLVPSHRCEKSEENLATVTILIRQRRVRGFAREDDVRMAQVVLKNVNVNL